MSKTLNFELPEEEYWMLRMKKSEQEYGTWREMVVDMCLDEDDEPDDVIETLVASEDGSSKK